MGRVKFHNYENFANLSDAYSNFIQKLMEIIDKIVPIQIKRTKTNSQQWFDSEISEKFRIRDKLFKKCKKSRLNVDKEIKKQHCKMFKISL